MGFRYLGPGLPCAIRFIDSITSLTRQISIQPCIIWLTRHFQKLPRVKFMLVMKSNSWKDTRIPRNSIRRNIHSKFLVHQSRDYETSNIAHVLSNQNLREAACYFSHFMHACTQKWNSNFKVLSHYTLPRLKQFLPRLPCCPADSLDMHTSSASTCLAVHTLSQIQQSSCFQSKK